MPDAWSPVTVVGSRRRIDVQLPAEVAVAELLPDLVQLLDESQNGAAPAWVLLRLGREPLDPERGLAEQGVGDGTMLFLSTVEAAPPPVAVDDFAEAVALTVDAAGGRWTAGARESALLAAAAAWLVVAAVAAGLAGEHFTRAYLGVGGGLLAGFAGVVLSRPVRGPAGSVVA
ncbi:MAG: EsaB/YukD family protein, partial [Candidatus Dormibacteraeota bacterium]|nr:EsaB/YukD family protein [Candidatus Dormibacteraeota bacterium]